MQKGIMKVKDWNLAGKMLANVMDVWNLCRTVFTNHKISPQILEWLVTDKGQEALYDAAESIAVAYEDTDEYKRELAENAQQSRHRPTIPHGSKWVIDREGIIYLKVTSNGRTKEQWETYFENEKVDAQGKKYRLSDDAKNVLQRASEAPTNGVIYKIAVRPGSKINSKDRYTKTIHKDAAVRGWKSPHWEVACLIRDLLTDEELEELGLWYIVAMHGSILDSGGDPHLLRSLVCRFLPVLAFILMTMSRNSERNLIMNPTKPSRLITTWWE